MKASELRIGNIIHRNVYDIDPDGNKVYDPDGNEEEVVDLDTLTAIITHKSNDYFLIPLTEEWLLKFGFKKYSNRAQYYHNEKFKYSFIHKTLAANFGRIKIELKYVHQLQNLYFALTGNELTLTGSLFEKVPR